jgi:hypothetical protein
MFIEQFDDATERRVRALARRFGLNPVTDRSKLVHLIFDIGLLFVNSASVVKGAKALIPRPEDHSGRDPND